MASILPPLKLSPGLFHQAIVQSGNFYGSWVMDEHSRKHGQQFAGHMNCSRTDTNVSAIVECLRNIPSYELTLANFMYMKDRMTTTKNLLKEVGISHAVVQKVGDSKRFLVQQPKESMRSGDFLKVPLLTGVTRDEGSMMIEAFVDYIMEAACNRSHTTNENESISLKNELFLQDFVKCLGADENSIHTLDLPFEESFLHLNLCDNFNSAIPGLVDLAGALIIKSITLEFAQYMYQHAPTYLYTFNFKGRKTKLGYGRTPKHVYFDGIAHSDELLYLFPDVRNPGMNETEMKIVTYITSLWSNFVINGNVSVSSSDLPNWPRMSTSTGPYLQIDQEMQIMQDFRKTYRNEWPQENLTYLG